MKKLWMVVVVGLALATTGFAQGRGGSGGGHASAGGGYSGGHGSGAIASVAMAGRSSGLAEIAPPTEGDLAPVLRGSYGGGYRGSYRGGYRGGYGGGYRGGYGYRGGHGYGGPCIGFGFSYARDRLAITVTRTATPRMAAPQRTPHLHTTHL